MSLKSRAVQLEEALGRRYEERRKLNEQVMELTRQINDFEDQLSDLELKAAVKGVSLR